jgi:hypothetical protein
LRGITSGFAGCDEEAPAKPEPAHKSSILNQCIFSGALYPANFATNLHRKLVAAMRRLIEAGTPFRLEKLRSSAGMFIDNT